MFVKAMHIDDWHEGFENGATILNPTLETIKEAISSLDGKSKTTVMLSDKDQGEHQMIVAGQWNNRMMVNVTANNLDFFSLVDPLGSKKSEILFVAGQNGDYEQRKLVPADWVLEAVQAFFETGELKQSMNWESDY